MIKALKNFLKDKFYILKVRDRMSASTQISQRKIFHYYQDCAKNNTFPKLKDTGYRVFSQFEEDGILVAIFAAIGIGKELFLEIGSNDGVNSNCANFAINFGWHGLFIDADKKSVKRGRNFYRKYPDPWSYSPKFVCEKVTRENINTIVKDTGFEGEIDLLSIDIDGNDYWIWDALDIVSPNVVIIETHVEFGMNNIVVPYDPNYSFPGVHPVYHGASPVAMTKLANKKGYRLVAANKYGSNLIFVKSELAGNLLPEIEVEETLWHISAKKCFKKFDEVKDMEYLEG